MLYEVITLAELQAAGRLGYILRTARQGERPSAGRGAYAGRSSSGNRAASGARSASGGAASAGRAAPEKTRAGKAPPIALRLAEWLYYCGIIGFETLVDSLVWQYTERPRVGAIAVSLGLMDEGSVDAVMSLRRRGEPFCSYNFV